MEYLTVRENQPPMMTQEAIDIITKAKYEADMSKARYEDIRDHIKAEMEVKKIKKFECPELAITYKAAYDSEKFDKKKFKLEHPEMYDDYAGITHNSASVVIKVAGDD